MGLKIKNVLVFSLILGLMSCARAPIKTKDQAMRPYKGELQFIDDLNFNNLIQGIQTHIEYFEKQDPEKIIEFGPQKITVGVYLENVKKLVENQEKELFNKEQFIYSLNENFDVYEVYGGKSWGDVFITSYFDPKIKGSMKPTPKYSQAIYETPEDLVSVDFGSFVDRFPKLELKNKTKVLEQKSRERILRGRLVASNTPTKFKVLPYFDREELEQEDVKNHLKNKVLAWVDPIDAFFLQIQGSGQIEFKGGKILKVGYASQNGHPYVPIGKFLLDHIPIEEMSLQKIEAHLRSIGWDEAQKILNKNPSYVFFQKIESKSLTYMGTEVIAGRTIATDYTYFPKGALGFLQFEKPIYLEGGESPEKWEKTSRFIIDQDTGGAIRGPHRLDLYWGSGESAKKVAGVMKNPGRLYYFVPKTKIDISN